MKKYLLLSLVFLPFVPLTAQQGVGIGTTMPNGKSILELSSTTKGFLLPRMTSGQRLAISSPPQGLMVFQNTPGADLGFWYYDGMDWQRFAKASEITGGSSSWTVAGSDQYSNVTGNVGIGVTSAITSKLTMRGDLFLKNTSIIDYSEIKFQSQTSSGGLLTFLEPDSVTAGARIRYRQQFNALILTNELAPDHGELILYDNNNVGVGTTYSTPAVSKLHVANGNPLVDFNDNGYIQLGFSSQENLVLGRTEILARDNGAASTLSLQEEGGTVKIGSGTPVATKLHLLGSGEAGLTTHGYMVMGSETGFNMVMDANEIQARNNGTFTTLRLQQDGGPLIVQGDALIVATNGNVGIGGELSPDASLHVDGDGIYNGTDPTLAFHQAGVQKGFAQLAGNNFRVGTFSDNNTGSFVVRTNGTDHMAVNASGNVGIGTVSPLGKLDLRGNLRIVHSGEAIGIDGNNSYMQFYQNGVAKFYMQEQGNNMVMATSSGNSAGRLHLWAAEVAINTSGPASGYSLSVGGEIICEELRVELQGNGPWPDYVFADEYKLRPLHELKSFVQTNKHLPNIPAAAQVENEGFDVGDMNRRLLEKVEELTLYVIQQQEEIDALKEAVNKMK